MKKTFILFTIITLFFACASDESATISDDKNSTTTVSAKSYDPERGEGKFSNVEISPTIEDVKVIDGEKVYSVKCSSCHKLTNEKLVGPGWKGVTARYRPEWIMNFSTNPDPMIDKDPKVQAQLEICLVRMPNQNISDDEARNIYEFMRKNDAKK